MAIPWRKRLMVRLVGLLLLAVVGILGLLLVPATRHYRAGVRQSFFEQAELAADSRLPAIEAALADRERLQRLSRVPGLASGVYDASGAKLAGDLPDAVERPLVELMRNPPARGARPWRAERQSHCYALFPLARGAGVLVVAKPAELIRRETWRYVGWFLGLLLLICLVLASAVLLFFQRAVLAPVQRIVQANVATADPSREMELIPDEQIPPDELGQIIRTRHQMLHKLREVRQELERSGRTLEQRVAQRTAELEQAQRQIYQAEKLATIGKLATSVAHEINNPLGIMAASVEELQRGLAGSHATCADTRRCFEILHAQVQRCKRIIDSLLRYSRPISGEAQPVGVPELCEETLDLVRYRATKEGKRLALELQARDLVVRARRVPLQQALVNLLENALDVTPGGGRVLLAARAACDSIEIAVSDEGGGVPPELRERIFEPFYTTKPAGDGTGMGLAIAGNFIRADGGAIDCLEADGGGACFLIRLPAAAAEPLPL